MSAYAALGPFGRKGNHRVKDCRRQIKLDKGTAIFTKDRNYQRPIETSGGSDPAASSNSEDNIDYDLRQYAPIVLSEVLLDRCCTPATIAIPYTGIDIKGGSPMANSWVTEEPHPNLMGLAIYGPQQIYF